MGSRSTDVDDPEPAAGLLPWSRPHERRRTRKWNPSIDDKLSSNCSSSEHKNSANDWISMPVSVVPLGLKGLVRS